jgi:hypothetical protein
VWAIHDGKIAIDGAMQKFRYCGAANPKSHGFGNKPVIDLGYLAALFEISVELLLRVMRSMQCADRYNRTPSDLPLKPARAA